MRFFSRFLGGNDPASGAEPDSTQPATADEQGQGLDGGRVATAADSASTDSSSTGPDLPFTPPPGWDLNAFAPPPIETPTASPIVPDPHVTAELRDRVVDVLKTVFDPEIPVDIYELGLIYDIQADAARRVHVTMTLTSPACPSAQQLPSEVQYKVKAIEGVTDASVEVVWEPPWDKDRMSEMARLTLGMF
jgi:FeS assembly SUF system protein